MTIELLIVFGTIITAVVLFTSERISFDISALIILTILTFSGILTPSEGLSGFSNQATITIAAMFVLSEGIRRTGVLDTVADYFSQLGKRNYWLALITMMLVIALISAFINNTAAVAIFIPIVVGTATKLEVSPSKLLMPLSFASMFGGVCTLIGTSTNILVSSIAQAHGEPPFSIFEFTPLGLVFVAVGLTYTLIIGIQLIPERRSDVEVTAQYNMNEYLTDVVLEPGFQHFGLSTEESALTEDLDLDVLQVFRESGDPSAGGPKAILRPGDVVRIRGSAQEIKKLIDREDVSLKPIKVWHDVDLETEHHTLVEAVIAPDSGLEAQQISDVNFLERFGAILLAIRHRGKLHQDEMEQISLAGGDSVLLSMEPDRVPEVEYDPAFVLVSEVGLPDYRADKMFIAIAILFGVVATAALNLAPIVITALVGCIFLVLTHCLTVEEAYQAINWKIILLLAGIIPLGVAMEKSGAATLISTSLLAVGQNLGSVAIISFFFLVSVLLTNIISNQATAVLLAPIAIQAAHTLDANPRPFLMAVTFAASLSFMTPIGYQTNTLIYGPGQYKFTDFTRVGTPLNLIFWIIATLLIPIIWPL